MRISPIIAKTRQIRPPRRVQQAPYPNRTGIINLLPKPIKDRTTQSQAFEKLVESIFRSMTFKPLSMKKLKAQGLDFEAAKIKLQQQGIPAEIIQVPSSDGNHVQILYAKHPQEKALSVFIPGQHGKVAKHIESGEVQKNWNAGKSICLSSFRGYMGNRGQPHHIGQARDLANILSYLEQSCPEDKTELIAHSMGCDTLTNALALKNESRTASSYQKIVLRAPYTNIAAMIERKIDTKIYLKPFRQLKKQVLELLSKISMNSFANLKYLKAASIKVYYSAADEKVPDKMSRAVYDELKRLNTDSDVTSVMHPSKHKMDHDATCLYFDM